MRGQCPECGEERPYWHSLNNDRYQCESCGQITEGYRLRRPRCVIRDMPKTFGGRAL